MEHLLDRDPGIVFVSETWLKSNKCSVTALVKTYGYVLVHNRRKDRQKETGGGVGVLLKQDFKYKRIPHKQFSSFEHIMINVSLTSTKSLVLVSIYRVLFVPVTTFLEEIVELFELLITLKKDIVLAGDVNIHMEEDELYANKFKDLLDTFNIIQHVNFPSHIQGHTLDIIATFGEQPEISNINGNLYDVSHHLLVDFNLAAAPEIKQLKEISYRKLMNIEPEKFKEEVSEKVTISEGKSFGENIKLYNNVLRGILDEHAPVKTKQMKVVPRAPWFDNEYENLRRERRKEEKLFHKTKLEHHHENYKSLRKKTTELAHQKKCDYYGEKLNGVNNKVLYSTINKLVDGEKESVLPDAKSDTELASSFLSYFKNKIDKIRDSFDTATVSEPPELYSGIKLCNFEPTTEEEIKTIVASFGVKSSPEDPIPAPLLKKHLELFVPIWTKLVNISLEQGSIECLKTAVILPLIKELDDHIDKDNHKNYRPVSNLEFVGKLVERVVSKRLVKHMTDNSLHSDFEHGFIHQKHCYLKLLTIC